MLFDLKTDRLIHQDIGQKQMYINYYTREVFNEGNNSPIGIVLCAEKNEAFVRYTLPEDNNQIFVSKYFTYLPTVEEFKGELQTEAFLKFTIIELLTFFHSAQKCRVGFFVCTRKNACFVLKYVVLFGIIAT